MLFLARQCLCLHVAGLELQCPLPKPSDIMKDVCRTLLVGGCFVQGMHFGVDVWG